MPKSSGIYQILNIFNNNIYVGSAVNLYKRINAHIAELKKGKHHSIKLQRAWNKYRNEAFSASILEYVPEKEKLLLCEQYWIDITGAFGKFGYNMAPKAGSQLGILRSERTKKLLAIRSTGNKYGLGYRHTSEARKKISEASHNMSQESRARIGAFHKNKPLSEETKQRISASHMGMKHSEESKAKISIAQKGREVTLEQREKLRVANVGKILSVEHKKKIAESIRRHWVTRRATA